MLTGVAFDGVWSAPAPKTSSEPRASLIHATSHLKTPACKDG